MVLVFTCRGALQSIEMKTQQVVSKPCAAEVAKAAALPGADPAAAEGQTGVGSSEGASPLIFEALMHEVIMGVQSGLEGLCGLRLPGSSRFACSQCCVSTAQGMPAPSRQ